MITEAQMQSIETFATSFKDICDGEELSMVLGNLATAQEWANSHPNISDDFNITDYSKY